MPDFLVTLAAAIGYIQAGDIDEAEVHWQTGPGDEPTCLTITVKRNVFARHAIDQASDE
jgi:hypothetical protein